MQKVPFVFPIVGGRKVEHLLQNIEALDISLSTEQMQYLESIIPFNLGFPSNLIVSRSRRFWTNFLIANLFTRVRALHMEGPWQ